MNICINFLLEPRLSCRILWLLGLSSNSHVRYRDDWQAGVDRMAERSLQRMRLSHLLTPEYWARVESGVSELQKHGTKVFFVRMPEHPAIRAFNEQTYAVSEKMHGIQTRTGESS